MRIRILTVSQKAPTWLITGFEEYAKRLSAFCVFELIEIRAEKRLPNADLERITLREGEKILSAIEPANHVIALDLKGKSYSTVALAKQLEKWQLHASTVDFVIGGADGLAKQVLTRANETWSLSELTFPHLFVRLILAEQIYRAYTILHHHPYHK